MSKRKHTTLIHYDIPEVITDEFIKEFCNHNTRCNEPFFINLKLFKVLDYLKNRYTDKKFNIHEVIYRIKNNIENAPICPICGNFIEFSTKSWYLKFCKNCIHTDEYKKYIVIKRQETNLKRYGVKNPGQSELCWNKRKLTCLKKYGVEHPWLNKEVKEKLMQTMIKRYGVDNAAKSDIIKEKIKKTNLERYGVTSYLCLLDKKEQAMLNKYGIKHPMESLKFIDKIAETTFKHYGVYCALQHSEIKEKMQNTCLKKYGVYNVAKSNIIREKTKQTCLEKYGVEYSLQNKEIRDKGIQTNLEKYGVENAGGSKLAQVKIYNTKKLNKTFNTSKIEEQTYEWLKTLYADVRRQYKSELYPFACDFYIPEIDLYIEIQGNWTHGPHPYNPANSEDAQLLEKWKSKSTDYYNGAINVWAKRDPLKRLTAKLNNLNYIEIFSNQIEEVQQQLSCFLQKVE